MSGEKMQEFDLIFIGAGLVNSISYYFMSKLNPDKKCLLIEQGEVIGGHHTWSFHAHEITEAAEKYGFEPSEIFQLLQPLISAQWADYEVRFEARKQVVPLGYCSIRSQKVHDAIMAEYSAGVILKSRAEILDSTTVSVEGIGELRARAVIDGRGQSCHFPGPMAFQKFYGVFIRCQPRDWVRPILMDATVEQDRDFRFIYLLPYPDGSTLIEDTRFSSTISQDRSASRKFIESWLKNEGVDQFELVEEEFGCLPIPLLGMKQPANSDKWPVAGYRAGLFNASTGYSFSCALRTALWLTDEGCVMSADQLTFQLAKMAEASWDDNEFNRRLNNMMVGAIESERRREIFSRFYKTLPAAVIARFYSGDLTIADKIRILNIRPNISWSRAFKSFLMPTNVGDSKHNDSMEVPR
jgi:lycopene beta-cyclase